MPTSTHIFLFATVYSRDQSRVFLWGMFGAGLGVYLFYHGFKMLQFKRLILNTPLSKVRSASMGLVELSGMAAGPTTIAAGITGDACYYYRATAWEYKGSGNNRGWHQVAQESMFVPFFLQDDTGRMLVNAQGADMNVHRNFKDEFGGSFFSAGELPVGAPALFLIRHGLSGKRVRLEEYCIKPDYPLFVFGTLGENVEQTSSPSLGSGVPVVHVSAATSSIQLRMGTAPSASAALRWLGLTSAARANGVRMDFGGANAIRPGLAANAAAPRAATAVARPPGAAASTWSDVSMDEVHKPGTRNRVPAVATQSANAALGGAVAAPARGFAQETGVALQDAPAADLPAAAVDDAATVAKNDGFDFNAPCAVGRGPGGSPFTITAESQRDLVRSLGWKSTACIWGGPALAVTCVYLMFSVMGWL